MANWAVIENGNITETYDSLPKNWRNISNLHASEGDLNSLIQFGWYPIEHEQVNYDGNTQILEKSDTVIQDKKVIQKYTVRNISTDELYETFISNLRKTRNKLLENSDYMCLVDIVNSRNSQYLVDITTYRQQLRNLPDLYPNNGTIYDYFAIVWPVKPDLNNYVINGN